MSKKDFRDDLFSTAIQFRGDTIQHAQRVPENLRDTVVSRFCVWLLDEAAETLQTNSQQVLSQWIQELHQRRIDGHPIESSEWEVCRARGLCATRLRPAEWLASGAIPSSSPLGHAIRAALLALVRYRRKTSPVSFRDVEEMIRTKLVSKCISCQNNMDNGA